MRLNWANFLYLWQDGYGRLGRGFVRSLLRNGTDVYPFTIGEMDMPSWYQRAKGLHFDVATVQLMPPHNMRHLPGRSIGFSMHESMRLPMGWADHVNEKCQMLIVPSPWLIEVFEEVKVPIRVVPGGIEPDECPIVPQNRHRPFTFLCLADRGNRKGHDIVWSAFYKAFDFKNQDVRLLMKCRPGSLRGLDFSYSTDMRMTIWKEDVEHMSDVFAQADACINPNRCEGYGMFPREAAASGLPTVVTNWSGTADDCEQWAIPLNKYQMVESHMENCGGKWAEPDEDEVVEVMRWLYFNQDEAKRRALASAKWMRENQTYDLAANKLLTVVAEFLGGIPPEPLPVVTERSNGHVKEPIAL